MNRYAIHIGPDGDEFTLTLGVEPLPGDTPGMRLFATFEAASWDEAVREYYARLDALELPLAGGGEDKNT